MKRFLAFLPLCLFLAVSLSASQLTEKLAAIRGISHITALADSTGFSEKWCITFTHPLRYGRACADSLPQRIFVCHVGFDRPTIVVTEGYWANYAENPHYREEISRLLNANVVVCEYRYFGKSLPVAAAHGSKLGAPGTKRYYSALTVENSLLDLHEVVTALKGIYPRKWLATGISKGGQTTMFYRARFPDDVDVSVPYVAPLNRALEDGRHEPFIEKLTGTPQGRDRVLDFQRSLCRRKAELLPLFEQQCKNRGYRFRVPVSEIYDYWILEYSFAYWQWYTPDERIPSDTLSAGAMADWMFRVNDPSYFQDNSPFLAFNVQAAKELGYYGYDTRPFAPYMNSLDTYDYMHRLMLPESLKKLKFSASLYRQTVRFLRRSDPRMIFIYGQYDPWSASGVCQWLDTSKKQNLHVCVQPAGSHLSRIGNMPTSMRRSIEAWLKAWME
jgi:hypothetical protein